LCDKALTHLQPALNNNTRKASHGSGNNSIYSDIDTETSQALSGTAATELESHLGECTFEEGVRIRTLYCNELAAELKEVHGMGLLPLLRCRYRDETKTSQVSSKTIVTELESHLGDVP